MKIVQMMGGATSSKPLPELPEGAEKWGINALWSVTRLQPRFKGWTRWFDLHPTDFIKGRKHNVYGWECQQTKPVMRFWPDPDMPSCRVYPHAEVRAKFGGTRFFCSSFDWLMALAIYEGFTRIDLFGWRMQHINYKNQLRSGQFWIRKAWEANIEVVNHSPSGLFVAKHVLDEPDLTGYKMYGLETTKRAECYNPRFSK